MTLTFEWCILNFLYIQYIFNQCAKYLNLLSLWHWSQTSVAGLCCYTTRVHKFIVSSLRAQLTWFNLKWSLSTFKGLYKRWDLIGSIHKIQVWNWWESFAVIQSLEIIIYNVSWKKCVHPPRWFQILQESELPESGVKLIKIYLCRIVLYV